MAVGKCQSGTYSNGERKYDSGQVFASFCSFCDFIPYFWGSEWDKERERCESGLQSFSLSSTHKMNKRKNRKAH